MTIDIPRLAQGEGSLVSVNASMDNTSIVATDKYNVYIVYDQGSKAATKYILPQPLPLNQQFSTEALLDFLNPFKPAFQILVILFVLGILGGILEAYFTERRHKGNK